MALKSTVSKVKLEVVDLDRHYYATHDLTLARHPSETELRVLVRLLVFALNAHERLAFGKGLSDSDEPDLWLHDLDGTIDLWVELGHPDEKTLARAAGRSRRVAVYAYSANPRLWWDALEAKSSRWKNLRVVSLDAAACEQLAGLAGESALQVTVQEGEVWVRSDTGEVHFVPTVLKA